MFSSINHTLKVCTKIPCIITASGLCPKCAGFPGGACHFVRQYQQQLHQYQPHCCVAVSIRVQLLYSCTKVLSYTLLRVSYVYVYRIRVLYSRTRTVHVKIKLFFTHYVKPPVHVRVHVQVLYKPRISVDATELRVK